MKTDHAEHKEQQRRERRRRRLPRNVDGLRCSLLSEMISIVVSLRLLVTPGVHHGIAGPLIPEWSFVHGCFGWVMTNSWVIKRCIRSTIIGAQPPQTSLIPCLSVSLSGTKFDWRSRCICVLRLKCWRNSLINWQTGLFNEDLIFGENKSNSLLDDNVDFGVVSIGWFSFGFEWWWCWRWWWGGSGNNIQIWSIDSSKSLLGEDEQITIDVVIFSYLSQWVVETSEDWLSINWVLSLTFDAKNYSVEWRPSLLSILSNTWIVIDSYWYSILSFFPPAKPFLIVSMD